MYCIKHNIYTVIKEAYLTELKLTMTLAGTHWAHIIILVHPKIRRRINDT